MAAPIVAELETLDRDIERLRARQLALDNELACLLAELIRVEVEAAAFHAELCDFGVPPSYAPHTTT